jgi:hypothetical protein
MEKAMRHPHGLLKTTIKSRVLQLASEVFPRCGNRLYVKEQEQLAEPA